MKIPDFSVERYNLIRDEVRQGPEAIWQEIIALCAAVPSRIQPEHVWQFGRDKPCWSNITVELGKRISDDLAKSDAFNCHSIIASDEWRITMLEKGPRWKAAENFNASGRAISEFFRNLQPGGLKSYKWKMYAIRNLALALQNDEIVRSMVADLSLNGRIPSEKLKGWTKEFSTRIGRGWGPVTVYHMLTDLGLTPKPDLHLRRSAIRMGLLSPAVPSSIAEDLITFKYDHEVVLAVIKLSEQITPAAYPQSPRSALREVDKVLMEWSRQGLVRAL